MTYWKTRASCNNCGAYVPYVKCGTCGQNICTCCGSDNIRIAIPKETEQ